MDHLPHLYVKLGHFLESLPLHTNHKHLFHVHGRARFLISPENVQVFLYTPVPDIQAERRTTVEQQLFSAVESSGVIKRSGAPWQEWENKQKTGEQETVSSAKRRLQNSRKNADLYEL